MFTQMLVPLDGSGTAEKVLPYSRYLAGKFKIPVRLLAVLDMAEMATQIAEDRALALDTVIDDGARKTENYLGEIAKTFLEPRSSARSKKAKLTRLSLQKGKVIGERLSRWLPMVVQGSRGC